MIFLLKHYLAASIFRMIWTSFLLFVVCVNGFAQPQSVGHGVCTIFNDYARTHWKSADSVEQVLDDISFYPKWRKDDLKESIIFLQSENGYTYYQDSMYCYFEGDVCSFVMPKFVTPCELMADTSSKAFFKKIKVSSVCFDKDGHVVYSANHFCEQRLSKLRKKIRDAEPQTAMNLSTWIPVVVRKETQTVQNYCTQEYPDSDIQTLILRYVQSIWRRYPEVCEVRFAFFSPYTNLQEDRVL